jgi:membrane-bound lytic murein transglycosylase B|uniref:Lytic murein transglycosylase n=1 Tax=Desulfobacca acetoxidans TaxID=60893 RepID=A0A7C3WRR7_9BACT
MWRLRIAVLGAAWWLILGGLAGAEKNSLPIAYVDLKYQLVRQGLDKDFVWKTFSDSRNQFLPEVVRKIAYLRKERPADYSHFLKPEVIARGRSYMQEHRRELDRAMLTYGVPQEVIVAILTVETNLGSITGKYPVFNVFASLAVMDTPEVMAETDLSPYLRDRLKKKAAWAARELRAFLRYCQENRLDPYQFCGSWAGAMGYAQFLPTSLVRCGVDGDGDGRVDLFNHADAIFSIANYLNKSGFRQHHRNTWRRAILAYNNSEAYADTVLTLAAWY